MESNYKKLLISQGYRFLGEHSALKICGWTKNSLFGRGVCYKERFYGIRSHKCAQISLTVNICCNDCLHCWRKRHNEPFTSVDDPEEILDKIKLAQSRFLSGYPGNKNIDLKRFREAQEPRHIAISLTGETLYYPKLNEFIKKAHKRGYTTFVVSNGALPRQLAIIEPPTQLYVSVNAPNEEIYLKVNRPIGKNSWGDYLKSLSVLKKLKKKTRTCLRITCIKGVNMIDAEGYAKIIKIAEPHFVEVKAYMLLGESRNRLRSENMPRYYEVRRFAEEICKYSGYKIIDEHQASRVVLLMKKDLKNRIMRF